MNSITNLVIQNKSYIKHSGGQEWQDIHTLKRDGMNHFTGNPKFDYSGDETYQTFWQILQGPSRCTIENWRKNEGAVEL